MSSFQAWHFPSGFSLKEAEAASMEEQALPAIRHPVLTEDRWADLLELLRRNRGEGLSTFPVARIVRAVDGVARRLQDEGDDLRARVLDHLGPQAGFSGPMARAVLDGMARDWREERMMGLLRSEFRDPAVLDGFRPGLEETRIRALGFPLSFHLGAGTVPGVAVTSLVRSLLVKSAVVLKPGRGDVVLPVVFAQGLREEDADVAESMAVLYWPEASRNLTERTLEEADLVVAYGGNETLRWVREKTPPETPLRPYRHRIGFGIVGRGALGEGSKRAAEHAARAVALFDQRGCVSPQVLLVEEGGEMDPAEWAGLLARALGELEGALPSGRVSLEEAAALQQLRGIGELEEGGGMGKVHHGGREAPWTVLFQPDGRPEPTCLNRSVRVLPVKDVADVWRVMEPWASYLQTVGVVGLGNRKDLVLEGLARLGVSRIAALAEVPWPRPWWHHDGAGPLQALVRWTDVEE